MKRSVGRIVFLTSILGISFLALNGCSSLTGLIDAADEFGCPMGSGVNCTTLSKTHERLTRELDQKEKERLFRGTASSSMPESSNSGNLSEEPPKGEKPSSVADKSPSNDREDGIGHPKAKSQATAFPIESLEAQLEEPKNFTPLEGKSNSQVRISSKASKGKSFPASSRTQKRNSRINEKVLLLWVLPWVDTDGDLHGESELWVRVRDARWGIERLRLDAMRRGPREGAP